MDRTVICTFSALSAVADITCSTAVLNIHVKAASTEAALTLSIMAFFQTEGTIHDRHKTAIEPAKDAKQSSNGTQFAAPLFQEHKFNNDHAGKNNKIERRLVEM